MQYITSGFIKLPIELTKSGVYALSQHETSQIKDKFFVL